MEVNKLLHLLKLVKSKRWILRYIKKYLCLRLHIVLQEKQNTVHYNYNCLECNDATNTQVFASGKPHLKSENPKKDFTTTKAPDQLSVISAVCCHLWTYGLTITMPLHHLVECSVRVSPYLMVTLLPFIWPL